MRAARGERVAASTRLAAQMGAALALAFTAGHLWFSGHWPWVVLTAFIVCSGARGRGDVVHKGVLRAAGAAAGTIVATLIAGSFPPRDATAVVIVFAVLGLAIWLRHRSYAWWAGCVTAMLSLLYGYFGQSAAPLLRIRLAGIAIGAAIGIAASWFVLPVRTTDVLRRRLGDMLAALSDVLAAGGDQDARQLRFTGTVGQLELISPAARFLRRRHGAGVIDAVRDLVPAVAALADAQADGELRRAVARNAGAVRRALGGRAGNPYQPVPPRQDQAPLLAIDAALGRLLLAIDHIVA